MYVIFAIFHQAEARSMKYLLHKVVRATKKGFIPSRLPEMADDMAGLFGV